MNDRLLGQVAYEAYRDRADGRSLATGEPLPAWDQLNAEIREAWQAAGRSSDNHPTRSAPGGTRHQG